MKKIGVMGTGTMGSGIIQVCPDQPDMRSSVERTAAVYFLPLHHLAGQTPIFISDIKKFHLSLISFIFSCMKNYK